MLDNKQCEAFLAVAESGSFDAAAVELHLTASAVSLRIQALEKALGQLLIIRGRPCSLTQTGQALLHYLQRVRLLEQDLLNGFRGQFPETQFTKITIASNADSLATWLLPTLKDVLQQQHILLDIRVDDQDHTHHLLQTGVVQACLSAEAIAMQGCHVVPLGLMRHRLVATPEFTHQWFKHGIHREALRQAPAVIFNQKDQIHVAALLKYFGLPSSAYPCHFVPASDPFVMAIRLGLGYGFVPEAQLGNMIERHELIDLMPETTIDIMLYWHHWQRQSPALQHLTQHIVEFSRAVLLQANSHAY
ncbi:MAG: LysR family transcriptional regulator ArgP [Acinetobacter sp.]